MDLAWDDHPVYPSSGVVSMWVHGWLLVNVGVGRWLPNSPRVTLFSKAMTMTMGQTLVVGGRFCVSRAAFVWLVVGDWSP